MACVAACTCHPQGSSNLLCNHTTGVCQCRQNVQGIGCDLCFVSKTMLHFRGQHCFIVFLLCLLLFRQTIGDSVVDLVVNLVNAAWLVH